MCEQGIASNDFSAFLVLPMAKEKESVELKAVDEAEEKKSRFYRLHGDAVEEVEELPAVRVGGKLLPEARLVAAGKDEMKTRSNEPDVGSLIEKDAEQQPEQWETAEVSKGLPWGWMALVGCAFAAGILWSLIEVSRSDDRRDELVEEAKEVLEKEQQEEMEAGEMIDTIEKVVGNYFDSRTVEELLRYVRHAERVKPLMEKQYAEKPLVPMRVKAIQSLDPLTIDSRATFWMVTCELEDGSTDQLLVEVISPTVAKVDWETTVCYQPMDWDKFAKERPEGYTGDFRVYAAEDNFYSHEFADSQAFACFRLKALDSMEVQYGYVARDSALAKKMEQMIRDNNGAPVPILLRLSVPEKGESKNALTIRKFICPRWLFVESPDAEL